MDTQRTTQRIKRRKRAQRIQAERDKQKSAEAVGKLNDDSADESPTRQKPSKPPSRRKKLKEPLYEEDIIDGFAILAFKTYEDLENAVKTHSEKHQARHKKKNHVVSDLDTSPAPVKNSKAKSAASATQNDIKNSPQARFNNHHISSSLHSKSHGPGVPANNTNGNQASYPSPYDSGGGSSTGGEITRINGPAGLMPLKDGLRDDRLSDIQNAEEEAESQKISASSNASSGRGYIASDTGSDLFTASRKSGELPASPRRSATAPSAAAIPTSSAATNLPPPPTPAPSLPGVISLRVPHRPSRRPLNCLQPASARASPDSPPPRVLSSASPPPSALAAVAAMVTDTAAAAPPGSAAPSYPPLYAPYSSVTVPGTAPSPYMAPSSPGAAAAIHRNERLSKSPAPNASKSTSGSPLQPPAGGGGSLWTPAISSGPPSAAASSSSSAASSAAATANRDTNSTSSLGKPHSPSADRDLFGNVSSLSRSSSTAAASSTQAAASTSTSTPGGLLSFSAKSPVVSASVAPPPWAASSLNPLPVPVSSAAASASSSGPFAPPVSAPQLFQPPHLAPPPASSPAVSSAQAAATTTAANPNPFSAESLFTSSADMLRRELDSRFLASSQDRAALAPPPFLRAEMHHHQHQHTHVHQHTTSPIIPPMMPPPMVGQRRAFKQVLKNFKDIPKLPGVDSPFYRQSSLALSAYNSFTPGLMHPGIGGTPFNPPTLTPFAPKIGPDPSKPKPVQKSGKWNAMHVRIAWEIHSKQQNKAAEVKAAVIAAGKQQPADLLRPPSGPHHMLGGPLPPPQMNPASTAFAALQPPAPPHHRPSPFVEPPPPASFLSPHLSPFPRFPGFAPPGASPFSGLSPLGAPGVFPGREINSLGQLSSPVHDQWSRLHRTAPGFPPPTHGSPWSSMSKGELERREMEERERLKRERERAEMERERAEKERAAQQAAAELARKKSQEEKERRERERERELERREREREKKMMMERQQQQQQMQHHHGHHSSHHHRNTAATPPDRKPPVGLSHSSRDRSPLRNPANENGDIKIKAEDEKIAAAMMERERYLYMARQHAAAAAAAMPRGMPSGAGTPLPPHPFAPPPAWDPYHPHRFDPMAMRFNPLAAHAAAAAMFREREEAAMVGAPSLYGPPMMERKPPPQGTPGKLTTPPPSAAAHHLFSPLPPLLGAPTPPSGKLPPPPSPKLMPPGPPLLPPHKLSTPPSRLVDMDMHKKESESQSSR
ncbi:autism susceptibility gene 2 protein-like isoform X3 [Cloeon dipterum]|uniref:autism susceptibility gene 2 protein-like isoform X3 n=1 Tax=Cloeon dipterum TaxID=197152 RepID=UPI00321F90EC